MNEILTFMQKRDERTDRRSRKEFYNLPTTAFGHRQELTRKEMLGHPVKVNVLDVLRNVKLVI